MDINSIQVQIESDLTQVISLLDLEEVRVKYLGRKGLIAELTGSIPSLPVEQRGAFGQQVNALKNKLLGMLQGKEKILKTQPNDLKNNNLDIGMPGIAQKLGHIHPITQIIDEICTIFNRMGFSALPGCIPAESPDISSSESSVSSISIL